LISFAAAGPLLFSAPATAQEDTSPKFNEVQKLGYLGRTSKSELARNVLDRLKSRHAHRYAADTTDRVRMWHEVMLDSVALDHTPDPDTGQVSFTQGGPGRTSRALAMTQIAVYDAVNAFRLQYEPYNRIGRAGRNASMDAAIAWAAYTVLRELYPAQQDRLNEILIKDLFSIRTSYRGHLRGFFVGRRAAYAMLARRAHDYSSNPEPSFGLGGRVADGALNVNGDPVNGGTTNVFDWEPDPNTPEFDVLNFNVSLGAFWGAVTPFTLERGDQFRIPPPPAPGSAKYLQAYQEVASVGGSPDNKGTPSTSTDETRFTGNFWGYDAVPLLGTPPRAYNQIAAQIATEQGVDDPVELARLLAMVNAALADSGVAAWDSKYYYNYWRPVTGIRRDDGVPETATDAAWDPVGVSIINVELPPGEAFVRPTPPFPAYPSGHATFGASMFQILTAFFGDDTPFTFVSDEYNGEGVDPINGAPRPLAPVFFPTLSAGQVDNGISRVYNGVHWNYDDIQGQALGENIAAHIVTDIDAFKPRKERPRRRGRHAE
jgi:hypothetical protein